MSSNVIAREGTGSGRSFVERLVGRPWFWVAFVLLVASWPIARAVLAPVPPRLPVLGAVPAFSLVDQDGRHVGTEQLRGHAWAASFIFTRCPTVCPAVTARMYDVQHHARGLGEAFRLVSFTVDPAHDTPEVLAEYARAHRASRVSWSFLTGPEDVVRDTVVSGFKIALDATDAADNPAGILHGTHLVLVDPQLRIRGYYDSADADAVTRLLRDAGLLLNRGG